MLAATGDNGVLRRVVQAVFFLEFVGNRLARLGGSGRRFVFGLACLQGLDRGILDEFWRIKIRLAGTVRNHIHACLLERIGLCGHSKGDGFGNVIEAVCQLHECLQKDAEEGSKKSGT